jgi:hypothetical protein
MNRTWTSVQLLALIIPLSGCVGHVSYPDQLRLCRVKGVIDGWGKTEVYEQEIPSIGKARFHLHISDVITHDNTIYDDKLGYWIRITGFTEGRKSFSPFQFSGIKEQMPMAYSPHNAYIEATSGEKIYAKQEIYFGAPSNPDVPDSETLPNPVDLNSDLVHSRPKSNSLGAYRSVYIRFPTSPPKSGDMWRIHLGTVQLGQAKVEVPEYQLCFYPGRSEFYIYRGAF